MVRQAIGSLLVVNCLAKYSLASVLDGHLFKLPPLLSLPVVEASGLLHQRVPIGLDGHFALPWWRPPPHQLPWRHCPGNFIDESSY